MAFRARLWTPDERHYLMSEFQHRRTTYLFFVISVGSVYEGLTEWFLEFLAKHRYGDYRLVHSGTSTTHIVFFDPEDHRRFGKAMAVYQSKIFYPHYLCRDTVTEWLRENEVSCIADAYEKHAFKLFDDRDAVHLALAFNLIEDGKRGWSRTSYVVKE